MTRLFGILFAIASLFTLAACSSGVSESAGGGAGTTTGGTDLVANATLDPETFSSDAFATDTDDDGEADQLVSVDNATLTITISDPLGKFSRVFQQITFNTFEVRFIKGNGAAPTLGPRSVGGSLTITLDEGTGDGQITIPLVDNVTKREFRDQASGSTIFNYTAQVRAIGSDTATGSRIVVTARTTIEIGEFVEDGG